MAVLAIPSAAAMIGALSGHLTYFGIVFYKIAGDFLNFLNTNVFELHQVQYHGGVSLLSVSVIRIQLLGGWSTSNSIDNYFNNCLNQKVTV